jgi:predicted transcriptional regulator
MAREVELSTLDLRYESYRMRNPALEARLLASIAERGIEEPLEGMAANERMVLLNGFKRHRCARRLGIGIVPYASLGEDEVLGIMNLLRVSNNKSLSILEQARFIEELRKLHKMGVAEIAEQLSRSKSWVSMRLGLIGEMSEKVREKIFSGSFPIYPYMYTLRQFMRMNGVKKQEIEDFVVAVSGHKLSVRDIEQLAHGYFRGPASFREAIQQGHMGLPLQQMREVPDDPDGCNEFEAVLLKDLEIVQKYMQRAMGKSENRRLKTRTFHAQAHLLTAGILSRARAFFETLRKLHDRSGQAQGDLSDAPGGDGRKRDCPADGHKP